MWKINSILTIKTYSMVGGREMADKRQTTETEFSLCNCYQPPPQHKIYPVHMLQVFKLYTQHARYILTHNLFMKQYLPMSRCD